MTNGEKQKAINALKISAPVIAMTQEKFTDYIQTLNKVMDWLEQEPTTKNSISNRTIICGDDCISRQAVIDMTGLSEWFDSSDSYNEFVIALSELPPVIPQEPKTGHWIKSRDSYGNNHFTCPFCEHDIATKADTWGDNYCSNCGARLD